MRSSEMDSILYGEPISDDGTAWVEGAVESQCVMQPHSCTTLLHDRILRRLLVFCVSVSQPMRAYISTAILLPSNQEGWRLVRLTES